MAVLKYRNPDGSFGTVDALATTGTGVGTTDHSQLTNRSAANSHPVSAITGLQAALDARPPILVVPSLDDVPAGTPAGTVIVVSSSAPPPVEPPVTGGRPTIAAMTQYAAGSGTITISKPTGLQDGDLLLLIVGSQASTNVTGITLASGFADAGWPAPVAPPADQRFNYAAIKKVSSAASEPSSYTFSIGGSTIDRVCAALLAIRGADPTSPVSAYAAPLGTLGTGVLRIPGVTVPDADSLVVAFTHTVNSAAPDTTVTAPGWTLYAEVEHPAGQSATASTDLVAIWTRAEDAGTVAVTSCTSAAGAAMAADAGALVVIRP